MTTSTMTILTIAALTLMVIASFIWTVSRPQGTIHWASLTSEQITTLTQDWDGEYYTLDNRRVTYQETERQLMIDYITNKRCLL